jgi:hypothetical protein
MHALGTNAFLGGKAHCPLGGCHAIADGSTMQVIGAGFGRTGTLSFKRALEDLGFGPTYHMQEVMRRPSHIDTWFRYARTGEVDWDELFSGFGSGVDYPVSCVWEELASHFPEAKVVLTVRDPQQWWASTVSTIYRFRTAFPAWVLRSVPVARHWVEMLDRLVWDGLFDGRFTDRDHAVSVFERHIEHVRATCPPERLLVFDVAEGWEPLCDFLDVPVPRHPFPHLNDAKVMRRVIAALWWGTRATPIVVISTTVVLAVRRRARCAG